MQIVFNLRNLFHPDSPSVENAFALRTALEALICFNQDYLRTHSVPGLYQTGVKYGRTLWWEDVPQIQYRGFGDCKSLSAWLIAEYRMTGMRADPIFRWRRNKDLSTDYHILVDTDFGLEDPSVKTGMNRVEQSQFR